MTSRRRIALMAAGAVVSAGAGVLLVASYSNSVAGQYGELRPVVVTTAGIPEGREISASMAMRRLAVRQVPVMFAPASAVVDPGEVIGLESRVRLSGGAYLTADLLRQPRGSVPGAAPGARGLVPVELSVRAPARLGAGARVDVLVGPSPEAGGRGSTRTVARSVRLVGIDAGEVDAGPEPEARRATVVVPRALAVGLVDAETAGRRITLLPRRLG